MNFSGFSGTFIRGNKLFELTNHLGNVLATVSDKHIGIDSTSDGYSDYYIANVVTANDYFPFGMNMPGRKYNSGSSYRYGFNGKENDNDVKGDGNQQNYGMRIYDTRLGRFISVDPITLKYPELTPYQYASNIPIKFIDMDGLEARYAEPTPRESLPIGSRINTTYRPSNTNGYTTRTTYENNEGSKYIPPSQYNQGSPRRSPADIYKEPDPNNPHERFIGPFIQKNSEYEKLINGVNTMANIWENKDEFSKLLMGYTKEVKTEVINIPALGIYTNNRITSITFADPGAQNLYEYLQGEWGKKLANIEAQYAPVPLNAPYPDPKCAPCVLPIDKVTPAMRQQRIEANKGKQIGKLFALIELGDSPESIIAHEIDKGTKDLKAVKKEVTDIPEIRSRNY